VILGGFFILSSLSRSFFSSFIMLLLSCFYLEYKKLFFKNNILKNKNSNTLFLFLFTAVISGPLFMPYLQEQERGIGSKEAFMA
jgi:DMSO reductase anchor subunit